MTSSAARKPGPSSACSLAATAVALALLLVPLAPAAAAKVQALGAGATLVTAHADKVAWTRPVEGRVDLLVSDVATGKQALVGSVTASPGRTLRVSELAFDGERIAWLDDRFGVDDVFLVDVATGVQSRLTNTPTAETGVALGDGVLAITGPGGVALRGLANGTSWTVAQGQSDSPGFWNGQPVWVALPGEGLGSVLQTLRGGQVETLDGDGEWLVHDASADGGVLAWQVWHIEKGTTGIAGVQVRARFGDANVNLTQLLPAPPQGPWTGDGKVAWLESHHEGVVLVVREASGSLQQIPVEAAKGDLAAGRAVLLSKSGDLGSIGLGGGAEAKGAPGAPAWALSLLLAGLGAVARRRPPC